MSGARFIVRCDDVGQALDQNLLDARLAYFRTWWETGGWGAEPIYLGVVPSQLGPPELDVLRAVCRDSEAQVSIHGWDHAQKVMDAEDLRAARVVLPMAHSVIPPYNRYDVELLPADLMHAGVGVAPVLFGGFDGEHHRFGEAPKLVNGWLHLSARPDLYAHSYRLVDVVDRIDDPGYPVVVTLHHRWDAPFLAGVRKLREALEGRIVSVDEARTVAP